MSDSLAGRTLSAPHKFFFKQKRKEPACPVLVQQLFGQVIDLPCKENLEHFGIEWLSIERKGRKEDIPKELRPHLRTIFKEDKYGQYIRDLVEFTEEVKERDNVMFLLPPQSPSTSSSSAESIDHEPPPSDVPNSDDESYEIVGTPDSEEDCLVIAAVRSAAKDAPPRFRRPFTEQERLVIAAVRSAAKGTKQEQTSPVTKRPKLESSSLPPSTELKELKKEIKEPKQEPKEETG